MAATISTGGALAQTPDLQAPHHPENLLVRFKPGTSDETRQTLHTTIGGELLHTYRNVSGLHLVKVPATELADALGDYLDSPDVLYAEPDYEVQLSAGPNDPYFGNLWGLHNTGQEINGNPGTFDADIDAREAWDGYQGYDEDPEDVTFGIAVIDTGIAYTHPDINEVPGDPEVGLNNMWTNPNPLYGDLDGNGFPDDLHGFNFVDAYPHFDPFDDHYQAHGTHVAGTIGAIGNNGVGVVGVNWHCNLVALKALGPLGFGVISDIVEAMDYVIDKEIRVSNNSYGLSVFSGALYNVIEESQSIGHIYVVAAGNSGTNNDVIPYYPCSFDLGNIICVAATDNKDQLASFRSWASNWGPTTVDLGGPGVDIYSTILAGDPWSRYPSYGFLSGTSMATPHVTGVAALVRFFYQPLTWQQVRDRVLDTTRGIDALNGITVTGGVVNAWGAMDCDGNGVTDACDRDCNAPEGCTEQPSCGGIGDCNGNGFPDSCDIAFGTSEDCNGNGIPDECTEDTDPFQGACCVGSTCTDLTIPPGNCSGTFYCGVSCQGLFCMPGGGE